jgi:CubicO group peptidase (beta-lactamase class C family)
VRRFTLIVVIALFIPVCSASAVTRCADPGKTWQRAAPQGLHMNAAQLQDALDWAALHTSATVAVYRHGCLAGSSRLDAATASVPLDGWSMTKTATALVVGRAWTLGKLRLDRPIGKLYPEADAAHARLTPRDLLTMTSGLHRNWLRDLSPQPDRVRDALSLRFDHRPGTWWEYQQSPPTLLANVVERSVKRDFQAFVQDELFTPLGIAPGSWTWERDRANHTEGWAHLHMTNGAWARLGQLLLHGGRWGGRRLISPTYVRAMVTPGRANKAYGYLTWLNRGGHYVMPAVEGQDEGTGPILPAAPRDAAIFAGNGEQRVYAIPSRDMVIVRLGENGSFEGDTRASVWTGRGGELDYELVRRVMLAVTDVRYADPGPYPGSETVLPPADQGIAGDAGDPEQVAAGLGAGPQAPPGCSPAGC